MLKYLGNLIRGVKESNNNSKSSLENRNVRDILKKFEKGNYIESMEELKILQRYASTGMVRLGLFNYLKGKAEASLTEQGRWFVRQL